jgi:hypothetical protein
MQDISKEKEEIIQYFQQFGEQFNSLEAESYSLQTETQNFSQEKEENYSMLSSM